MSSLFRESISQDLLRRSVAEDDTLNAGVESSKGVKFSLKDELQGVQGTGSNDVRCFSWAANLIRRSGH